MPRELPACTPRKQLLLLDLQKSSHYAKSNCLLPVAKSRMSVGKAFVIYFSVLALTPVKCELLRSARPHARTICLPPLLLSQLPVAANKSVHERDKERSETHDKM